MQPRYRLAHICLTICLIRIFFAGWYNHSLQLQMQEYRAKIQRWRYEGSGYLPYDIGVPVEQMNFVEQPALPISTGDGSLYYAIKRITFQLKQDICYYSSPTAEDPPKVIRKKGDWVVVAAPSTGLTQGRGISSYPAYEKNWRYAYPLPLETDWWQTQGEEKLYVRLEDLSKLRRDVFAEKRNIKAEFSDVFVYGVRDQQLLSEEFKKEWMLSQYLEQKYTFGSEAALVSQDESLMRGGIYVSGDLREPLWDIWNTLLLTGAVLCLIVPPLYQKVKRRGEPATN